MLRGDGWAAHLVTAGVTAAVSLGGSYFAFKEQVTESNVVQNAVTFDRIRDLENRIDIMQRQINELTVRNIKLENDNTSLQIKLGLLVSQNNIEGANVVVINDLLDSLDVPAWCKRVEFTSEEDELPKFVMNHINPRYAFEYDISYSLYVGKTDFDIHEKSQASDYYTNDLKVYKEKSWTDFVEVVSTPSGNLEPRRFWKFYHRIEDGPELVCGWEVP
jgi:TolA-binding protein